MQEYITYGIIALTVTYLVYSIYSSVKPGKKPSGCTGCTGCELMNNAKTTPQKKVVKTHSCSQKV